MISSTISFDVQQRVILGAEKGPKTFAGAACELTTKEKKWGRFHTIERLESDPSKFKVVTKWKWIEAIVNAFRNLVSWGEYSQRKATITRQMIGGLTEYMDANRGLGIGYNHCVMNQHASKSKDINMLILQGAKSFALQNGVSEEDADWYLSSWKASIPKFQLNDSFQI